MLGPWPPERKLLVGVSKLLPRTVVLNAGVQLALAWAMDRSCTWGSTRAICMPRLCSSASFTASSTVRRFTLSPGAFDWVAGGCATCAKTDTCVPATVSARARTYRPAANLVRISQTLHKPCLHGARWTKVRVTPCNHGSAAAARAAVDLVTKRHSTQGRASLLTIP